MFRHAFAAAVIAAVISGTAANAAVTEMNFNELKPAKTYTYVYGDYSHAGYVLSADRCSSPAGTCFVTSGTTLSDLDRTQAALVNFMGSAVSTVSRADGGAFSLLSMDLAPNSGNWSGSSATEVGALFSFVFADGSILNNVEYIIPNTPGQRLTVTNLGFDLAPLTSFSWKPGKNASSFLQFDNIRLSAPVPEPATWAMMIAGFGLVGCAMRRRTRMAHA